MTALESNHRAGGVYREVKIVANGHCHSTQPSHPAVPLDSPRLLCSHRELSTRQGHLDVFRRWRVRVVSHFPECSKPLTRLRQVLFRLWKNRLRSQVQDLRHLRLRRDHSNLQTDRKRRDHRPDGPGWRWGPRGVGGRLMDVWGCG